MSQDVKRYFNGQECESNVANSVVKSVDHDRVVAELNNQLYEYNMETSELKAEIKELNATIEYFKDRVRVFRNRDRRFENKTELKAENDKLKRVVNLLKIQRCRLLSEKFAGFPLNALNAESELDAELDSIEREIK